MYYKYPRTLHLPWSEGLSHDDIMAADCSHFVGKEVVVTEKIDGECTTMYCDHIHARSIDSKHHPSRTWVKTLHGSIKHEIPEGFRVCGENVYAKHSIEYSNLPSYFLVFGIYTPDNICLSWDDTKEFAALLGLQTVPELYRGLWDESKIKSLWTGRSVYFGAGEGYVVRVSEAFNYSDHASKAAKFVRKDHVQTDEHWLLQPVVKNALQAEI